MSTIITINSGDLISNSRADLNTNLANLNSDKIETSVIDTDPSLTANSDAKLPSQKAVKAYVDSGGNVNASTVLKGIVQEATAAQVAAGTAAGSTGARLYINPSALVGSIFKFGGTGVDGALNITSGATTINLGNAAAVVKNYTSISITGTGSLIFTNPHANGTVVILKSQGVVTVTSSTNPAIDLRLMGGATNSNGNGTISYPNTGNVQAFGSGVHVGVSTFVGKGFNIFAGAGGATGAGAGGTTVPGVGGFGGGGLYIECRGALNITSTISVAGQNGGNGTGGSGTGTPPGGGGGGGSADGVIGGNAQGSGAGAGGGGGGGGSIWILYNSLTTNSGTYTVTGGTGGAASGGSCVGGAGGAGVSLVVLNVEYI
jgi:hypothetical protein